MTISDTIWKIRSKANLSQAAFAELVGVSPQAVQKWESGKSIPDLEKLIMISKRFDVSLDSLIFDSDTRTQESFLYGKVVHPNYVNTQPWESYESEMMVEFRQCMDEGIDFSAFEGICKAIETLPRGEIKKKFGDVIFSAVLQAKKQREYPYVEPSDLQTIRSLRKPYVFSKKMPTDSQMEKKLYGAWMGRVCGCLLGKTIEGMKSGELVSLLKETGNYPMKRYILCAEITDEMCKKYTYRLEGRYYADQGQGMPVDDDTNYTVLAQKLVEEYGRGFTSNDVAKVWIRSQNKDSFCTAERVAFRNLIAGYDPPESAIYKNPYREWIGAQIRGDYFGYINPGNPELAAEMGYRDACISHIKNGVYGEMFVCAMIACAAVTDSIENIILGGLAEIPYTSRLYEKIMEVLKGYREGVSQQKCFKKIHEEFDEMLEHNWVHTIPNAMIVAASLLYGDGDFSKSICMAVETAFDTDCNGATVGSVLGMRGGISCIDSCWTDPVHDELETTILGIGSVKISECAKKTLKHMK